MKLILTSNSLPQAYRKVCACCTLSIYTDIKYGTLIRYNKNIAVKDYVYRGYLCKKCYDLYIGYTKSYSRMSDKCFLCEEFCSQKCNRYITGDGYVRCHAECFEKELDIELTLVDNNFY